MRSTYRRPGVWARIQQTVSIVLLFTLVDAVLVAALLACMFALFGVIGR